MVPCVSSRLYGRANTPTCSRYSPPTWLRKIGVDRDLRIGDSRFGLSDGAGAPPRAPKSVTASWWAFSLRRAPICFQDVAQPAPITTSSAKCVSYGPWFGPLHGSRCSRHRRPSPTHRTDYASSAFGRPWISVSVARSILMRSWLRWSGCGTSALIQTNAVRKRIPAKRASSSTAARIWSNFYLCAARLQARA